MTCTRSIRPLKGSPDIPSLPIAFVDIQAIRRLDTDDHSTLPGFSLLAIDTASRCHYFSLPSDDAREELMQALNSAMISSTSEMGK